MTWGTLERRRCGDYDINVLAAVATHCTRLQHQREERLERDDVDEETEGAFQDTEQNYLWIERVREGWGWGSVTYTEPEERQCHALHRVVPIRAGPSFVA
jgi:hypothetical protein